MCFIHPLPRFADHVYIWSCVINTFAIPAPLQNRQGDSLVTASDDKSIHLYDSTTWKLHQVLYGHKSEVTSVRFSHDGQMIVSGDASGVGKLWKARVRHNEGGKVVFVKVATYNCRLRSTLTPTIVLLFLQRRYTILRKSLFRKMQTVGLNSILWFPS